VESLAVLVLYLGDRRYGPIAATHEDVVDEPCERFEPNSLVVNFDLDVRIGMMIRIGALAYFEKFRCAESGASKSEDDSSEVMSELTETLIQ
jgi:hypothetical protein